MAMTKTVKVDNVTFDLLVKLKEKCAKLDEKITYDFVIYELIKQNIVHEMFESEYQEYERRIKEREEKLMSLFLNSDDLASSCS